jgi:peptidoglycan hydrolase-like protein with peptidoglycan-binding domain
LENWAWPAKKRGDQDQVVRTVQYLLSSQGSSLPPDGVFGELTEAAVSSFQEAQGIDESGVVGNETWEALIVDLDLGARGDAVKAAQTQLYIRGTLPEVDGVYSMKMNISVRRFQVLKHLETDGVVERETWHAMVSDADLPAVSQELSRDSFNWQDKLRSMLGPEG